MASKETTGSSSAPKPSPRPSPEHQPESATQAAPEAAAQSTPKAAARTTPQATVAPTSETAAQAAPKPKRKAKVAAQAAPKPEPALKPDPEPAPEPDPEPEPASEVTSRAAAKAAPKVALRAARRRRPDRAAAERALKDAALGLLERDGILAGLNMQEVADAAGVNRGLIHHYFGSRSALIRAAIDDELRAAWAAIADIRSQPFVKRASFVFRWNIRNPMFARLIALLALDGDESFEPIPFADRQLEEIEHARSAGLLPDDTDAVAMLVAWEAAMEGYALIREGAARQLGVPQRELDWRVLAELGRISGSDLTRQTPTTTEAPD